MADYGTDVTSANHFLFSRGAAPSGATQTKTFLRVGQNIRRARSFFSSVGRQEQQTVATDRFQWAMIDVNYVGDTPRKTYQLKASAFPSLLGAFLITAEIDTRGPVHRVVRYMRMEAASDTDAVSGKYVMAAVLEEEAKYTGAAPGMHRLVVKLRQQWSTAMPLSLHTILAQRARAPDVCLWLGDTRHDLFTCTASCHVTAQLCTCMVHAKVTWTDEDPTAAERAHEAHPTFSRQNYLPPGIQLLEQIRLAPRKVVERFRSAHGAAYLCHPECLRLATSVTHPVTLTQEVDRCPAQDEHSPIYDMLVRREAVHFPVLALAHVARDPAAEALTRALKTYVQVAMTFVRAEDGYDACGYVVVPGVTPTDMRLLVGEDPLEIEGRYVHMRLLHVLGYADEGCVLTTPAIWRYAALTLLALHGVASRLTPLRERLTFADIDAWEPAVWDSEAYMDRFTVPPALDASRAVPGGTPLGGLLRTREDIPVDMCSEGVRATLLVHRATACPFTILTGMAGSGKTFACEQVCELAEQRSGSQHRVCLATAYTNTVVNNNHVSGNMPALTTHKMCQRLSGLLPQQLTLRNIADRVGTADDLPEETQEVEASASEVGPKAMRLLWIDEGGMYSLETLAALVTAAYAAPLEHVVVSGDVRTQLQPMGVGQPVADLMRAFPSRVFDFKAHCHRIDGSLAPKDRWALWHNMQAVAQGAPEDVLDDGNSRSTFLAIDDLDVVRDDLTGARIGVQAMGTVMERAFGWLGDGCFPLWICHSRAQCDAVNVICAIRHYSGPGYGPRTHAGARQSIASAVQDTDGQSFVGRPPPAFVGGIALVREPGRHELLRRNGRFRVVEIFAYAAKRKDTKMPWVPAVAKRAGGTLGGDHKKRRLPDQEAEGYAPDTEAEGADEGACVPANADCYDSVVDVDCLRNSTETREAFAQAQRSDDMDSLTVLPRANFVVLETLDERQKKLVVCEADIMPYGLHKTLVAGDACTICAAQGMNIDTVVCVFVGRSAFHADRRMVYTAMSRASRRVLVLAERAAFFRAVETYSEPTAGVLDYMVQGATCRDTYARWRQDEPLADATGSVETALAEIEGQEKRGAVFMV